MNKESVELPQTCVSSGEGNFLFTSESVTEGHPDKICDQISDAVLDAILRREAELEEQGYVSARGNRASMERVRVACETFVTTGTILVAGEVRTQAYVDIDTIAREVVRSIGYDRAKYGFDCDTCGVLNLIHGQSEDIAAGVDSSSETRHLDTDELDPHEVIGAGDQGMMFGYACDETDVLMPLPIYVAHRLAERLALVRKNGTIPYLRPDGKTQVTVRYENHEPVAIEKILISTQHAKGFTSDEIKEDLIAHVIEPVLAMLDGVDTNLDPSCIHVNPTGTFVVGGPKGDTGLTGRKIIVDTYGGMGRHGGGAFSGKDATKVDRSAAYAARWVAKNVVAAGLARRCEVQVSYAIGMAHPLSLMVNTFGTNTVSVAAIEAAVNEVFDLRPGAIIDRLKLRRPIFQKTAAYGHFGRKDPDFTWEQTDRVDELKAAVARYV